MARRRLAAWRVMLIKLRLLECEDWIGYVYALVNNVIHAHKRNCA